MTTSTIALDSINRVNALTDRIKKRKKEYQEAPVWVSSQRAHSYTEAWKKAEADPFHLRRAKAFARVLEDSPVVIRDGELIVGSLTKYVRGAEVMVEFSPYEILRRLEEGRIEGLSETVTAHVEDQDKKALKESATYWKGKSTRDAVLEAWRRQLGKGYIDLADDGSMVIDHNLQSSPKGSTVFNPKVFKGGFNAIIKMARDEKTKMAKAVGQRAMSAGDYHKTVVLESSIIACEALIKFAGKHAELARSLAEKEKNPARKKELKEIAERCDWVPANPPRNFAEAVQSLWFVHLGLMKEASFPTGPCPGRLDQNLYPFYEKDLKDGKLTRQDAAEILGCWWVKMNELEAFRSFNIMKYATASLLQQATLGGQTKEGRDASNELTFLILEVARQMKMPQPGLYIRWYPGISQDLMLKAIETNRDVGGGIPAYLSDQSAVNRARALGVELEDAIEWSAAGCLNYVIGNTNFLPRGVGNVVLPKVLEITLHNGVDPRTGKRVGLKTGDATKFTSLEELYTAWEKQFDYFVGKLMQGVYVGQSAKMERYSAPLTTAILNGCLEKGLDAYEGGERYLPMSLNYGMKGHAEMADCLAAIKKLVFEQKKVTMAELVKALDTNFEGKEDLRKLCLKAPKYGNDDDYVDDIYNHITLRTQEIMLSRRDPWTGKPISITRPAVAAHYWEGTVVGALPSGRKAWLPLYDAGLSPMQGADVNGPTALINSATKVNHYPAEQNGLVFNMKFSRPMLQTRESIVKLLAMMKTFFDRGGWHIQFNITSREDLLDAQKHPEQWRDLVVRVAGYSAYFVDLPRDVQDEIIARTEHKV